MNIKLKDLLYSTSNENMHRIFEEKDVDNIDKSQQEEVDNIQSLSAATLTVVEKFIAQKVNSTLPNFKTSLVDIASHLDKKEKTNPLGPLSKKLLNALSQLKIKNLQIDPMEIKGDQEEGLDPVSYAFYERMQLIPVFITNKSDQPLGGSKSGKEFAAIFYIPAMHTPILKDNQRLHSMMFGVPVPEQVKGKDPETGEETSAEIMIHRNLKQLHPQMITKEEIPVIQAAFKNDKDTFLAQLEKKSSTRNPTGPNEKPAESVNSNESFVYKQGLSILAEAFTDEESSDTVDTFYADREAFEELIKKATSNEKDPDQKDDKSYIVDGLLKAAAKDKSPVSMYNNAFNISVNRQDGSDPDNVIDFAETIRITKEGDSFKFSVQYKSKDLNLGLPSGKTDFKDVPSSELTQETKKDLIKFIASGISEISDENNKTNSINLFDEIFEPLGLTYEKVEPHVQSAATSRKNKKAKEEKEKYIELINNILDESDSYGQDSASDKNKDKPEEIIIFKINKLGDFVLLDFKNSNLKLTINDIDINLNLNVKEKRKLSQKFIKRLAELATTKQLEGIIDDMLADKWTLDNNDRDNSVDSELFGLLERFAGKREEVTGSLQEKINEEISNRIKIINSIEPNLQKDLTDLFAPLNKLGLTIPSDAIKKNITVYTKSPDEFLNDLKDFGNDLFKEARSTNADQEAISAKIRDEVKKNIDKIPIDIKLFIDVVVSDQFFGDLDLDSFYDAFANQASRLVNAANFNADDGLTEDQVKQIVIDSYYEFTGFGKQSVGSSVIKSHYEIKNKSLLSESEIIKEGIGQFWATFKGVMIGKTAAGLVAAMLGLSGLPAIAITLGGAMVGAALLKKVGKLIDNIPLVDSLNTALLAAFKDSRLNFRKDGNDDIKNIIGERKDLADSLKTAISELIKSEIKGTVRQYFLSIHDILEDCNIVLKENGTDVSPEDIASVKQQVEESERFDNLNEEAEAFVEAMYNIPMEIAKSMGPVYKDRINYTTSKLIMDRVLKKTPGLSEIITAYTSKNKKSDEPEEAEGSEKELTTDGFIYMQGLSMLLEETGSEVKGFRKRAGKQKATTVDAVDLFEKIKLNISDYIKEVIDVKTSGYDELIKYLKSKGQLKEPGSLTKLASKSDKIKNMGFDRTIIKKSHVIAGLSKVTGIPSSKFSQMFQESFAADAPLLLEKKHPVFIQDKPVYDKMSSYLFEDKDFMAYAINDKKKRRQNNKNWLQEEIVFGNLVKILLEEDETSQSSGEAASYGGCYSPDGRFYFEEVNIDGQKSFYVTNLARKIRSAPYEVNNAKISFRSSKGSSLAKNVGGDGDDPTPFVKIKIKDQEIEIRADGTADNFKQNVSKLMDMQEKLGKNPTSMSAEEIRSIQDNTVKREVIKIKNQLKGLKVEIDPKTGKVSLKTSSGELLGDKTISKFKEAQSRTFKVKEKKYETYKDKFKAGLDGDEGNIQTDVSVLSQQQTKINGFLKYKLGGDRENFVVYKGLAIPKEYMSGDPQFSNINWGETDVIEGVKTFSTDGKIITVDICKGENGETIKIIASGADKIASAQDVMKIRDNLVGNAVKSSKLGDKPVNDSSVSENVEMTEKARTSRERGSDDDELQDEVPGAEETGAEETEAEEPEAEEPEAEETNAEETNAEETKAEEPGAEETKAEEPGAEETKAEEPGAEETKAEETEAVKESVPAEEVHNEGEQAKVVKKIKDAEDGNKVSITKDEETTIVKLETKAGEFFEGTGKTLEDAWTDFSEKIEPYALKLKLGLQKDWQLLFGPGSSDPEVLKLQGLIKQYSENISKLEDQYSSPSEIKNVKDSLEQLKKSLEVAKSQSASEEISNSINDISNLHDEMKEAISNADDEKQKQLAELIRQKNSALALKISNTSKLEQLNDQLKNAEDVLRSSRAYAKGLRDGESLRNDLASKKDSLTQAQEKLKVAQEKLKAAKDGSVKSVKDADNAIKTAKKSFEDLKAKAESSNQFKNFESAEGEIESLSLKLDQLEPKIQANEVNLEKIKTNIEAYKIQSEKIFKEIEETVNKGGVVNEEKANNLLKVQNKIKEFQTQKDVIEKEIANQKIELNKLNQDIDTQKQLMDNNREIHDQYVSKIDNLEKEYNQAVETHGKLQADRDTADYSEMEQGVKDAQSGVDTAQKDFDATQKDLSTAEDQLDVNARESDADGLFGRKSVEDVQKAAEEKFNAAKEKLQQAVNNGDDALIGKEQEEILSNIKQEIANAEDQIKELTSASKEAGGEKAQEIARQIAEKKMLIQSAQDQLSEIEQSGLFNTANKAVVDTVKSLQDYASAVSTKFEALSDELTSVGSSYFGFHHLAQAKGDDALDMFLNYTGGALLDMIPIAMWGWKAFAAAEGSAKGVVYEEKLKDSLTAAESNIFEYGLATPIAYSIINFLTEQKEFVKTLGFNLKGQLPRGSKSENIIDSESSGDVSALFSQEMHDMTKEKLKSMKENSMMGKLFGTKPISDEDLIAGMEKELKDAIGTTLTGLMLNYDSKRAAELKTKTNANIKEYNANTKRLAKKSRSLGKYGGGAAAATVGLALGSGGFALPLLFAYGGYKLATTDLASSVTEFAAEESFKAIRNTRKESGVRDFDNVLQTDPKVKKDVDAILGVVKSTAKKIKNIQDSYKRIHKNKLSKLLFESDQKTITTKDIKRKLESQGVSIYGYMSSADKNFAGAEAHLLSKIANIFEAYFGIQIPDVPKSELGDQIEAQSRVQQTVDSSAKVGQPSNPHIVNNFGDIPMPSGPNDPINPAQFMHTAAYSGGQNNSAIAMLIVQQNEMMMKMFEKMMQGQMTMPQAAQQVQQIAGDKVSNLDASLDKALKVIRANTPTISKEDAKMIYYTIKSDSLTNVIAELNQKADAIRQSTGASGKDIDTSDYKDLDEGAYSRAIKQRFNIIDDDQTADSKSIDALAQFLMIEVLGIESDYQVVGEKSKYINLSTVSDFIRQVSKKLLEGKPNIQNRPHIDIKDDSDNKKALSNNNKEVEKIINKMTIRTENRFVNKKVIKRKKSFDIINEEIYHKQRLSHLLFEENKIINTDRRKKKSSVDLSSEWRRIWNIDQ